MQKIDPFVWKNEEFFFETINQKKYKQLPQISDRKQLVLDKICKKPQRLVFKLIPTWSCNLRCPHCFVLKKLNKKFEPEKPNLESLKKFIIWHKKKYDHNNLISVLLGGEPTLYADICLDYIEVIKSFNGLCSMTTNMSVSVDQKILRIFKLLDSCQVSIDGSEDVHNKTRIPYKDQFNGFRLILENLKKLKQHDLLSKVHVCASFRQDLYTEKDKYELKLVLRALGITNIKIGCASESSYFDKSKSRKFTAMNILKAPCCSFRYMSDFTIQGNNIYADYFDKTDKSYLGSLDGNFEEIPSRYESYIKDNMPILKDNTCLSCSALPICWGQCVGHTLYDDFVPSNFCYQDSMIKKMQNQMNDDEYLKEFCEVTT